MKTTKYILIALFTAGTTLGAFAENTNPERSGEIREKRRERMVERFDKDGDGKLSPKERKHARKILQNQRNRAEMDQRCERCGERGKRNDRGERGEYKKGGNTERAARGGGARK